MNFPQTTQQRPLVSPSHHILYHYTLTLFCSHIGIYARILMVFLMDKDARPTPKDMKLWVDVLRWVKRGAPGGALGFFTYMELSTR